MPCRLVLGTETEENRMASYTDDLKQVDWKRAMSSQLLDNYPNIIEMGDAFQVREPDWELGRR